MTIFGNTNPKMINISVIVPVYNRPEELKELLDSLTIQHFKEATEVIVVEDGSSITSEEAVDQFISQLNIKYITQPNAGPAAHVTEERKTLLANTSFSSTPIAPCLPISSTR